MRASKKPDDTRSRLLAEARDLYLESGESGLSLREVARRVGVSAAAVYRHFDSKETLVDAACTQGFEVFSSYLMRALDRRTPRDRLLATGAQYRQFGLENPRDYQFIFMRAVPHEAVDGMPRASTFRMLVDRVSECMESSVLAKGPPEEIAVLIWAHVHGLVSLRLAGHLDSIGNADTFAAFYDGSVRRLLVGLAP